MDNLTIGFILVGVALVLLVAELFLTTGGVLLVAAGIADLIGLAMIFTYGDPYLGVVTLAAQAIILPLFVALAFYVWPHTPMGKRLMLRRATRDDDTLASTPAIQGLEELRGRIGKAVSVLRPAGVVEFDGRRVDCLSEGLLIEPDTWVRCVDVKAGRVLVRPIDKPPDLNELGNIAYD
jgi:membrane-bound serine protease (ClpP class)